MSRIDLKINQALVVKAIRAFREQFGSEPEVVLRSPGRINLIGEHTDYNQGYVMPSAVSKGMYIAVEANDDCVHEWRALDLGESESIGADGLGTLRGNWSDFVQGAWLAVRELEPSLPYFKLTMTSDLPIGSGMSSSSALTCGIIAALNGLIGNKISRDRIPHIAFDVERGFVGLRGGIMDQYSSVLSEYGKLLLIDCKDYTHRYVEIDPSLHLFLVHSRVQRKLTGSEYNTRSDECSAAVEFISTHFPVNSLREVTLEDLMHLKESMDPILFRRSLHVVEENKRVLDCEAALARKDHESVGEILYAGHAGLRDLFEISIPELDFIVDHSRGEESILGARLMGGGFGGCAIHAATKPASEEYKETLTNEYYARFGIEPAFIDIHLTGGTYLLDDHFS